MLNVLVIRLGLERDDDDDVKTGGQGRGAAECHAAVQFITRLQGEGDGERWIDRHGKKEEGDSHSSRSTTQRLLADRLWTVCSVSVVFSLMSAY